MIKTIIFDFGGVYFTFNSIKLGIELSKELKIPMENLQKAWLPNIALFEKGGCTENQFWNSFLNSIDREYNIKKLHEKIINHFKPIQKTEELINKLKYKYVVGMLTNQTTWIDELNKKYSFFDKFELLIISKNEGTRKPEEKIFKILLEKVDCKPSEIVFIDDDIDYEEVVKKQEIKFIHFRNHKQLIDDLEKLGVKV